ncbi:hypothetical protein Q9L42_000120 (plasmid) [Methylomarinum sp. Ch1-1]|uniref:DUF7668 domain-containing protein n=1 Tax=Methylomarinum roseum TaxID=3067653 RepID=A0AAU7NP47_9GAMM|nr:hypothetical protein [Methylomarinum sp. Ch1-1]MDP4523117.1 hypothetical protein [Methylomarinum sp. Ch1-1]
MSATVPVLKDQNNQTPVASVWRSAISEIVDAFKDGDFKVTRRVVGLQPISDTDAKRIEKNLLAYGATLTSLPEETWDTSVCQWMNGYWDVLVDLFTIEEGASDLVMAIRISEEGATYVYDVQSVHVP